MNAISYFPVDAFLEQNQGDFVIDVERLQITLKRRGYRNADTSRE